MPYIERHQREDLESLTGQLLGRIALCDELAYVVTRLVDGWARARVEVRLDDPDCTPDFYDHVQVLGVLEAVKTEYYRRRVAPYEDNKRLDNGDVF